LGDHPEIRLVSRPEAAAKALPDAVQVADRPTTGPRDTSGREPSFPATRSPVSVWRCRRTHRDDGVDVSRAEIGPFNSLAGPRELRLSSKVSVSPSSLPSKTTESLSS